MRRAVVLAVAWVLTACAGSGSDPAAAPAKRDSAVDVAACLEEKGWEVEAQPDGSILGSHPREQQDQYLADVSACQDELGLSESGPMTQAEAEEYFDALLEAADCVRKLGYHVDEPPSRQAAIEALMQPIIDLGGWDPYAEPTTLASSQEEINEVYTECPRPLM